MAPTTMTKGTAAFLVSEANGYRSRAEITFTITSTDVTDFPDGIPSGLVLGEITSTGKFVRVDPSASGTGEDGAAAILLERIDSPTAGDVTVTAIVRDAEVVASKLTHSDYSPDNTDVEIADMAALGIIAR